MNVVCSPISLNLKNTLFSFFLKSTWPLSQFSSPKSMDPLKKHHDNMIPTFPSASNMPRLSSSIAKCLTVSIAIITETEIFALPEGKLLLPSSPPKYELSLLQMQTHQLSYTKQVIQECPLWNDFTWCEKEVSQILLSPKLLPVGPK